MIHLITIYEYALVAVVEGGRAGGGFDWFSIAR